MPSQQRELLIQLHVKISDNNSINPLFIILICIE